MGINDEKNRGDSFAPVQLFGGPHTLVVRVLVFESIPENKLVFFIKSTTNRGILVGLHLPRDKKY